MSIRQIVRSILMCTGCKTEYGGPEGRATTGELRDEACDAGWTFPNRVRGDGRPSSHIDDVCPSCTPGWRNRSADTSRAAPGHVHGGADGSGNLVCPSCALPREAGHYLCRACWSALPARTQASLKRRDRHALPRLRELLDQIHHGTPLAQIEVAP